MNWAALAAITSCIGLLVSVILAVFVYGRLTQRVDDNLKRTQENCSLLSAHADKLGEHDVAIAKLEQWKEGFHAAVCVSQRG